MSGPRKTRLLVLTVGMIALLASFPPILHLFRTGYRDRNVIEKLPAGYADDVSRLNKAQIAETWDIPSDPSRGQEQLRELLLRAQASHLHVSIAGARHSMGGQTIYPGGIAINMLPFKGMKLDEDTNLFHVQAGAKWADIIPYLDQHGRSIEVMQSDNSFTVGGSLSVNCHGWQYGRPPIASTVASFHLMKADGTVVRCSRSENPELFSLALGGYGLFGVILDVNLRVVPNEFYVAEAHRVKPADYNRVYHELTKNRSDIGMAYGRINVAPNSFLEDGIVTLLKRRPTDRATSDTLTDEKP